jgi:PrtD family type I secretion system ABC transporter
MNNNNNNFIRDKLISPEVRRSLVVVLILGLVINLLLLTSPLYMLQMYDRVLTSRSEETLYALSFIALFLLAGFGCLEVIRSRIMVNVSVIIDSNLNSKVFTSLFKNALSKGGGLGTQPFRDLEALRSVVSGNGLIALFDLPWAPFFIILIFLMHPLLGTVALVGALITLIIAIVSERLSRPLMKETNIKQIKATRFVEDCIGNVDAIFALGMLDKIRTRWLNAYEQSVGSGALAAERISGFTGATKALRMILQSTMLGFGGWLALQDAISPGSMVAASIIFGRALAPLEQSIAASRGLMSARGAIQRIEELLSRYESETLPMPLSAPTGRLDVKELALGLPGVSKPLLQGVSFSLVPGEVLAVIGPSASGKSSLARALLGLWKPARGAIRLDGAELSQWDHNQLGSYLGYLPQDVELLTGTVGENIARFGDEDPSGIVAAATQAACHEMILNLPEGYDSNIGNGGFRLSGGQSQRVGLARSFYGNPVLVVLDEPDANLDVEGVAAFEAALADLKKRKITVVLITHNSRLVRHADKAMLLTNGVMAFLGTPEELAERIGRRPTTENFK